MAQVLPYEKREAFTEALMALVMAGIDFKAEPGAADQLDLEASIDRLDGMTISMVMTEAEALRRSNGADTRIGASRYDGAVNPAE